MNLDAQSVADAAARIAGRVHRTPVVRSRALDAATGCEVHLKCENLQRIGAFKIRGATNLLAQLSDAEKARGVVTHSSGNHAQAVALAARELGIHATIVMPRTAPAVKRRATEGYGAHVVTCEPTQAARDAAAAQIIESTGATLVHPYDDPRIVAGQATAARELLEDVPQLAAVLAPVGGGGLLSGTTLSCAARGVAPIGCEPTGADDASRGLASGVRVTEQTPDTIADGLLTTLGALPFEILRTHAVPIVTVADDRTLAAMRFVWERTKLVIEPSAAVAVAVLLDRRRPELLGQPVGVILSGGNVDLSPLFDALGGGGERS